MTLYPIFLNDLLVLAKTEPIYCLSEDTLLGLPERLIHTNCHGFFVMVESRKFSVCRYLNRGWELVSEHTELREALQFLINNKVT
jgi:hypothetical protein